MITSFTFLWHLNTIFQTLKNGIVDLRDRESCWFEQIHVAHLTRRFVHIYQKRDIPDTWTQIKDMLSK